MTAPQVAPAKGRRLYCRYPLGVPAAIVCDDIETECKIVDLSLGGARLHCQRHLSAGTVVFLKHDEMNCRAGLRALVIKSYDDTLHLAFDLDCEMEEALLLFLMVSPHVPSPPVSASLSG